MDIRHAVGVKVGIPEATLAALDEYRTSPHVTERERVALEFCEQVTRDDLAVSDACFARLRAHFSEVEVLDVVSVVGYQIFASKFAKAFALAPQGFSSPAPEVV
ncbi:MAG: carboxymuconolactone decarboxylase family protein [Candidatus Rokuibacteriota bacterium]